MSTRCLIGIQNEDKTITSIYCHHDGYIQGGVGETLFKHYKDEDKIRKLMDLGDMSSLGTEPVDNPNAWNDTKMLKESILNGTYAQSYSQLHPDNMCDTYKSRGEDAPAVTHKG